MEGTRGLLRHALATIAYRGGKAFRGAPPSFATFTPFDAGQGQPASTRTPVEIVAHMSDLFDWALSIAQGAQQWNNAEPQAWDAEVGRFFASLQRLDAYLASDAMLAVSVGQLLQGPIADALTHVGQLTMLRRLAGAPVRGENYFVADITPGRVGVDQPPPRREFE